MTRAVTTCRRRGVVAALALVMAAGVAAAPPLGEDGGGWTRERLMATRPAWANPFLALLPVGAEPDMRYWRARMEMEARDRRAGLPALAVAGTPVAETEPPGVLGGNDHPAVGALLGAFGTTPWTATDQAVVGWLRAIPSPGGFAAEPDDAIPTATAVAIGPGQRVVLDGVVGDGAYGSGGPTPSGDFDFFAVTAAAGDPVEVLVMTPDPGADLDPIVGLYAADGTLIGYNDNIPLSGFLWNRDAWLRVEVPAGGTYVVAVGGATGGGGDGLPTDPLTPGTGPGAGSEGSYQVVIGVAAPTPHDRDCYRAAVRPGDVLGATVLGASGVEIVSLGDEELVATSGGDLSGLYPAVSSLPGGGEGTVARVLETGGEVAVCVSRPIFYRLGDYRLELRVARSALDSEPGDERQVVFVDFDGAIVDARSFGGLDPAAALSPLSAYLAGWGLGPADEGPLIDAILAVVRDNLADDVRLRGANGDAAASGLPAEFAIEVWSSRDHPDPGMAANVARVVVGGSIDQLGIATVGIAENIDPGNLDPGGTAIVLLDLLSAAADNPTSLNGVERAPGTSLRDVVALALGNIVSHEAGHLFGNFHTSRDVGPPTIMDSGGDLDNVLGVGEDEIAGTADDLDVDLGPDDYAPQEIFDGVENTLEVVSFGLPQGGLRPRAAAAPAALILGPAPLGDEADGIVNLGNVGTAPLAVAAPVLSGPGADRFAVASSNLPADLDPGAAATVSVAFVADQVGPVDAVLRVATDDPGSGVLELPLNGRGGVPVAAIAPAAHDFGTIVYGDPGSFLTTEVTVSNSGAGPLTVSSAVFSSGTAHRFAVDAGAPPFELAAGDSRVIRVAFRPGGEVGPSHTVLAVLGDDPAAPRLDVALEGFADGPDIVGSTPSPFIYGDITLGGSAWRDFGFTNTGYRTLEMAGATLSGDDVSAFAITSGGGPVSLPPGAEATVRVAATPGAEGRFEAELHVSSNDPDEPDLVVELVVHCVVPMIVVDPPAFDFRAVRLDDQRTQRFYLSNEDAGRLRVEPPMLVGDGADSFEITHGGGGPIQLLQGGIWPLDVRFQPTSEGVVDAVLVFDSNDPAAPHLEVGLRGTGALPALRIEKRCQATARPECTLTVSNVALVPAPDVTVEDELPMPLGWYGDDCGAGAPSGVVWRWEITSLGPGDQRSCTIAFELLGDVGGPLLNTATVRWSGTPPGEVEDEATVVVPLAAPVPALDAGRAALLALLLALAGAWLLRRR